MAKKVLKIEDVEEPNLYREMFPYSEFPKAEFEKNGVPQEIPDEVWITDTTFRYVGSEVRDGRKLEKIAMEMKMRVGEGGKVKMKLTDQSGEGTLYFDNAAGQLVSSQSQSKMKMQISVLGQEMVQEMKILSKVEIQPQKPAEKSAE